MRELKVYINAGLVGHRVINKGLATCKEEGDVTLTSSFLFGPAN
jgi:hypothetical protein